MKNQNLVKIILINFLILILAAIFIEVCSYNEYKKIFASYIESQNKVNERLESPKVKLGYKLIKKFDYDKFKTEMKRPVYMNSKKRPLLFMGCSYTYGWGLNNDQLLSTKMAKLTNRTSYNRGIAASGAQHIYYQLNRYDFYKEVPDAEYIIYTFIYDHISRLYKHQLAFFGLETNLRYKVKNGKLEEVKPLFLPMYSLYTVRRIQYGIEKKEVANREQSFDFFLITMKESLKLARKHYKNVKFVILTYQDPSNETLTEQEFESLRKAGFIVIDAEELVGHELTSQKYRIEDGDHPSEKAWNEVAPKLAKALKL